MRNYLENPTHCTVSEFWADLTATLDVFGLTHLLEAQLAKPCLGHPMYAARRLQSRILSLRSQLAVLEQWAAAELDEHAAAA